MPKPLPDTQRKILEEMGKGTQLARVQAYAWGPTKHMLGDKPVAFGSVAQLALHGYIRPIDKIEIGAPCIRYALTEKGQAELAKAAA